MTACLPVFCPNQTSTLELPQMVRSCGKTNELKNSRMSHSGGPFSFHALRLQRRMKYVVKQSVATLIFCSEHEEFFMLQMKHIMNNCATTQQTTNWIDKGFASIVPFTCLKQSWNKPRALSSYNFSRISSLPLSRSLFRCLSLWFSLSLSRHP